jgi:hypothetical protein
MKLKAGYSQAMPKRDSSTLSQNLSNQLNDLKSQIVSARVLDIVLDENHPKFDEVGQLNGIGTIYYAINNKSGVQEYIHTAKPYNPQSKTFPLINELVLLVNLPNQNIGQNSSNSSYYYLDPISIWNHPHHNAYPDPSKSLLSPSQNQDYQQTEEGSVRRVSDDSTEINLNSPINLSQNTFIEKINIHPLMPFMGDVLYEGRHGQSLRFGSTSKSKSQYANNWSENGINGDPISIIRNGQPNNSSDDGWVPITEDINNDLSSIYLTSFQKIPFKSKFLSEYVQPQIISNSSRIVINSTSDNIILNSSKNIYLTSIDQINIESPKTYFDSSDIRLGSSNATEPVLKGNITNDILKDLTNAISTLAQLLTVEKNWPAGNLSVSNNPIASNVVSQLANISNILNNDSLKSQTTKVL